jgi:acetylornithine deacetylase/succinyl-diaminopimelate desuccinylase-like protein
MENTEATIFIDKLWQESITPSLIEYIKIPNKSPDFDPDWAANGYMEEAVTLMCEWYNKHPIAGATLDVVRIEGRTPTLFIDVPGSLDKTILLYGHLDKQPEMTGWRDDLGPWKPVLEGDKLYGRGGADDGYALFASVTAILALQQQGIRHANLKIIIEASEESGSPDLPAYMELLSDRIGQPDLVICLDSGCGNYDQLWLTTSLRGLVGGKLKVQVLTEGVHSGDAGGVVPSSFRICRQLLARIEDETTGTMPVAVFNCEIPPQRQQQAKHAAKVLGEAIFNRFAFQGDTHCMSDDATELVLNRTWRPTLEVTGADGLPAIANAGNTMRPQTSLKLSMRVPPLVDGATAGAALKRILEADAPNDAEICFDLTQADTGWNAPATEAWLDAAIDRCSQDFFGKPSVNMGEGGTIPFMAMLGDQYPEAQFVITGVLGPKSNAHGPNEFLHIPMARKLTACVASVIEQHYLQYS